MDGGVCIETIDIIIPVYNAYDALCQCVESVFKYTDLSQNRLILVEDKSTDGQILPYLRSLQNKNGVLLLENPQNLGFPGSVNRGLQQGSGDVVLLNSDTVVTEGWLEKLAACAYSDRNIATVTPFSNNGAITSLPNYLQENTLPQGYGVDSYAALVAKASPRQYPPIPVGIGFCLYIKRSVLDEIGLLDEQSYGQGYGEENDFCCRAVQLGYIHALCDDCYIYHSGTQSFADDQKNALEKKNLMVLQKRYPKQFEENQVFCRQNPLWAWQENIHLRTALNNGKKNVLHVLHRSFHPDALDNLGGTQIHVQDLCQHTRKETNPIVLGMDRGFVRVSVYTESEAFELHFPCSLPLDYPPFYAKELRAIFETVLDGLQVDLVHVHQTKFLSLDIYEVAAERGLPLFATLHDFHALCSNLTFFDDTEECCLLKPNADCKRCTEKNHNISPQVDYVAKCREEHRKVLHLCRQIFVPSHSVKEIYLQYYPELAEKIVVIGHGLRALTAPAKSWQPEVGALRIAFVGGLSPVKGSKLIGKMLSAPQPGIEWFVIGLVGDASLLEMQRQDIHFLGRYERQDLPSLLEENRIDLVAILSMVPETFCYVISEALFCGVPVLCTDIGALGERVREMDCGWLVPPTAQPAEVLAVLRERVMAPAEYERVKENIQKLHLKSIEEMAAEYLEVYLAHTAEKSPPTRGQNGAVLRALTFAHSSEEIPAASSAIAKIGSLEAELAMWRNSLTYRALVRFQGLERKMRALLARVRAVFTKR